MVFLKFPIDVSASPQSSVLIYVEHENKFCEPSVRSRWTPLANLIVSEFGSLFLLPTKLCDCSCVNLENQNFVCYCSFSTYRSVSFLYLLSDLYYFFCIYWTILYTFSFVTIIVYSCYFCQLSRVVWSIIMCLFCVNI